LPEQWGEKTRYVDFYDMKADVESLLKNKEVSFVKTEHPALHPGRAANIVSGGKVVGFVSYGDFRDSARIAGEIFALYVLKDYYGKGVGQKLMQAAFAALDGYQEIVLWVLEDNKRAIAFYEKMGFVFDGQEKVIDLGKAVKEKRMIYDRSSNC